MNKLLLLTVPKLMKKKYLTVDGNFAVQSER